MECDGGRSNLFVRKQFQNICLFHCRDKKPLWCFRKCHPLTLYGFIHRHDLQTCMVYHHILTNPHNNTHTLTYLLAPSATHNHYKKLNCNSTTMYFAIRPILLQHSQHHLLFLTLRVLLGITLTRFFALVQILIVFLQTSVANNICYSLNFFIKFLL